MKTYMVILALVALLAGCARPHQAAPLPTIGGTRFVTVIVQAPTHTPYPTFTLTPSQTPYPIYTPAPIIVTATFLPVTSTSTSIPTAAQRPLATSVTQVPTIPVQGAGTDITLYSAIVQCINGTDITRFLVGNISADIITNYEHDKYTFANVDECTASFGAKLKSLEQIRICLGSIKEPSSDELKTIRLSAINGIGSLVRVREIFGGNLCRYGDLVLKNTTALNDALSASRGAQDNLRYVQAWLDKNRQ